MENIMITRNPMLAMASAQTTLDGFGMSECRLGVWEAARVMESATSIDARDRFAVKGHLGLATTAAKSAVNSIAYVPGTHAWSPPPC